MMQVNDILAMRHLKPRPPVLVIDETTLKCSNDTGPVCGCDEKYAQINDYKPFFPGAVNPYNRRNLPDQQHFHVFWKRVHIGSSVPAFDKPVALHRTDFPDNFTPPQTPEDLDNPMFVRQPKYAQSYLLDKLTQCPREHSDICHCRTN